MHLGEFKREVEYLDTEVDFDTPPVEQTIKVNTDSIITGVDAVLPEKVQQRVERVDALLR